MILYLFDEYSWKKFPPLTPCLINSLNSFSVSSTRTSTYLESIRVASGRTRNGKRRPEPLVLYVGSKTVLVPIQCVET